MALVTCALQAGAAQRSESAIHARVFFALVVFMAAAERHLYAHNAVRAWQKDSERAHWPALACSFREGEITNIRPPRDRPLRGDTQLRALACVSTTALRRTWVAFHPHFCSVRHGVRSGWGVVPQQLHVQTPAPPRPAPTLQRISPDRCHHGEVSVHHAHESECDGHECDEHA
eukprot:scaffold40929_cov56-Phaeocystis_antarctica.AAC.2